MENDNPAERKLTRGRSERAGGEGGMEDDTGLFSRYQAVEWFRINASGSAYNSIWICIRGLRRERAARAHPRSHRDSRNSRVHIPWGLYFSHSLPLSLPPLLHSCNIDITIKRIYRPFSTCSLCHVPFFIYIPLYSLYLPRARAFVPTFVGNGSSVIEHVCRDILIFPARAIIHARTSEIFL